MVVPHAKVAGGRQGEEEVEAVSCDSSASGGFVDGEELLWLAIVERTP